MKKWSHPGSNRGPSLRKSDVITNYTMRPSREKEEKVTYNKIVGNKGKWRNQKFLKVKHKKTKR